MWPKAPPEPGRMHRDWQAYALTLSIPIGPKRVRVDKDVASKSKALPQSPKRWPGLFARLQLWPTKEPGEHCHEAIADPIRSAL